MAMARPKADHWPSPIEIIFSCSVCHATASEIYNNDDLFHNGSSSNDDQSRIKLWLTDCSHLTCGKHLEGGGVPNHAPGEKPRAACPLCIIETGDKTKRTLFEIRGCREGTFHSDIDKSWFDLPPIRLEGHGKGMEALRFQYLSLIRFGTNVASKLRKSNEALNQSQRKSIEETSSRRTSEAENEQLRRRVSDLEKCEKELKPWREREEKISYYLGIFSEVTRENEKLREQLVAMGYAVPRRAYSVGSAHVREGTSRDDQGQNNHLPDVDYAERSAKAQTGQQYASPNNQHDQVGSGSSRTISGPPEPITNIHAPVSLNAGLEKRKEREELEFNENVPRKSPRIVRGEQRHVVTSFRGALDHSNVSSSAGIQPLPGILPGQVLRHEQQRGPNEYELYNERPAYEDQPWQSEVSRRTENMGPAFVQSPYQPRVDEAEKYTDGPTQYSQSAFFQNMPEMNTRNTHLIQAYTPYQEDHAISKQIQNFHYQDQRQSDTMHGEHEQLRSFPSPSPTTLRQNAYASAQMRRPTLVHPNDQRSFSSPIRRYGTSYRTPAPTKRPYKYQADSVTSPFFQKTGAVDHVGRVTLPSQLSFRSANQQQQQTRHSPLRHQAPPSDTLRMPPPPRPTAARTHNTPAPNASHSFPAPSSPLFSRPRVLAPSTPRNADGLFERPSQPTSSSNPFQVDSTPNQAYQTPSRYHHHREDQTRQQRHPAPHTTSYTSNPSNPFVFPGVTQTPQHTRAYNFTGNTASANNVWTARPGGVSMLVGSRSGVSRPSREWMREGLGVGTPGLGGRRSVRR